MSFARDEIMSFILKNTYVNREFKFSIQAVTKDTKRCPETTRKQVMRLVEEGMLEQLPKGKREHSRRFRISPSNLESLLSNPLQWITNYFNGGKEW